MKHIKPRDTDTDHRIEDMIDDTFVFPSVIFVRDGDGRWWARTNTPGKANGMTISDTISWKLDYPNDGGLISNLEGALRAADRILAEHE